MAINLVKGQRIDLSKGTDFALIGLGWGTNKYTGGSAFDLDVSVFMTDEHDKVVNEVDFIFYGNLKHPSGAVEHMGDNRVGGDDANEDEEVIKIDFTKMPAKVHKIAVTVTIYEAAKRKQNFGMVSNAYIRLDKLNDISEMRGDTELSYNLGNEFSTETAVVVAEIYRDNKHWRFNAIGSGFSGGLQALCENYGLDASE